MFMAALDGSIVIISLPAIFRGINLDPLQPGHIGYLLWMLMGYLICIAVLVVSFGKLGDLFGRVRMYNAGFAVFTLASIALSLTPGTGVHAALFLIIMRVVQGIGGAMLWANSTAILVDAFPPDERGFALGINITAALIGQFVGLLAGGLLAAIDWRLIFWVNVPFGLFGTIWAYMKLHDTGEQKRAKIDIAGNITFAAGLIAILVAITYGIQPYGADLMGWTSPPVLGLGTLGIVLLGVFVVIENVVESPMFDLKLFKIRSFAAGNLSSLFVSIGRGGLQFMLVIWLQGIWLPLHGYSFESTPLWAGIYMLPLTVGLLIVGSFAGKLSDRYGARYFSTGGVALVALCFCGLLLLPANFLYFPFALLLFFIGVGFGLFSAPNSSSIMSNVAPSERGQASGMRATFNNAGQVLSIGIFFSLIIFGLSATLSSTMQKSLLQQNVPASVATEVSHTPPVSSLFAAFLGYNPMTKLIPTDTLNALPSQNSAVLTGTTFFPTLISGPFIRGLHFTLFFSIFLFICAAFASWFRGPHRAVVEEVQAREVIPE
jgi:MFS family permease